MDLYIVEQTGEIMVFQSDELKALHPKLSHAAFLLETPQDELGDDARNLSVLRSFLQADAPVKTSRRRKRISLS